MGEHTFIANSRREVVVEHEPPLLSETLQKQLGVTALDSLMFAEPVETHPYSDIETGLKHAIIGQDEAIESIMQALNREKLRNPRRPLANLLFLGPTGVGKSETAKELARQLHGDESAFLKIDCSSFSQGHEVMALVGAPPSYVGREQAPMLSPSIIEQEKSIVLFDEVEKGSQELWDLMLQIMDDGEVMLTGTGEKVSFKDSIIIMTSNLGATEMMSLLDPKRVGFNLSQESQVTASKDQIEGAAKGALRKHFRPEFINRFDRQVVFQPLDDNQLGTVLDRYVESANDRYLDSGIQLVLSPALRNEIVTSNEDRRQFGARPILREYDHMIESMLAQQLGSGGIPEGSRVFALANKDISPQHRPQSGSVHFYYQSDERLQEEVLRKRTSAEGREAAEAEPELSPSTVLAVIEG